MVEVYEEVERLIQMGRALARAVRHSLQAPGTLGDAVTRDMRVAEGRKPHLPQARVARRSSP